MMLFVVAISPRVLNRASFMGFMNKCFPSCGVLDYALLILMVGGGYWGSTAYDGGLKYGTLYIEVAQRRRTNCNVIGWEPS
jgi:hypothetical protein